MTSYSILDLNSDLKFQMFHTWFKLLTMLDKSCTVRTVIIVCGIGSFIVSIIETTYLRLTDQILHVGSTQGPLHTRDREPVTLFCTSNTLIGGNGWSQSKFTSHYAWGTNGVCDCKMDVKTSWFPTWHQLGHVSWSLGLFSKTTSWR
jgi:hypothetical protein